MDWEAFLPPLGGSFFGVIAAFGLNYVYQSYNNRRDKIKYINMIGSEIDMCISVLELDIVQLLPVDRWTSAVNSGALKLFEVDIELKSLCIDYYRIFDFNNRAGKYTGWPWERLSRENGSRFELSEVRPFLKSREWLLSELRKLRDVEWLNPADAKAPGYNDPMYEEI